MNRLIVRPAVTLLALFTALTGLLYPLAVTGIAQLLFPAAAHGALVMRDGTPLGSRLVGQNFDSPQYFWGRPSATTPYPYNPGASGGSNLGPLNPALLEAAKQRLAALRSANSEDRMPVPVELVTASGSGLDPDLSLAGIEYQIPRVANARHLSSTALLNLALAHSQEPRLGFLGEPRVNVLELNLALDALQPGTH